MANNAKPWKTSEEAVVWRISHWVTKLRFAKFVQEDVRHSKAHMEQNEMNNVEEKKLRLVLSDFAEENVNEDCYKDARNDDKVD